MQQTMPIFLIVAALLGMFLLLFAAFAGPSPAKARTRRLTAVRERHDGKTSVVEAQMRRILAARETKLDLALTRFIPNPALLQKRLEMTGRDIPFGKFVVVNIALITIASVALLIQGLPILLALLVGMFIGIGLPHMVIGYLVKKRINQFNAKFPDAIELLVRGLRSGLPISETLGVVASEVPGPVGVEFRAVSDKMKIGRTMEAALQESADRLGTPEFQFLRDHAGNPARDRRQSGGNAVQPGRRAAQARADEAQDPRDVRRNRRRRPTSSARCRSSCSA